MKFEMPTRTKFLYRIMNFSNIETEEIALFYFRHRDEFYNNDQVSDLTGYSPNTVRRVRKNLGKNGFWFSTIGSTRNRAHRLIGLSTGDKVVSGLIITEEQFQRLQEAPDSMKIRDGDSGKIKVDINQNKTQILVNSIFR